MASSDPDYYEILHVPTNASHTEIRAAYRRESLKHHPDRNAGKRGSTEKFQEIADAYAILGDPESKKIYDRQRQSKQSPTGNQFFEQFFGGQNKRPDPEESFFGAFEDFLKPHMEQVPAATGFVLPFWQVVCAICCAILGFVFAGPPGVVGGGVIGRYLGKMRDQTGQPLMGNWKSMSGGLKQQLLAQLAEQFFKSR